LAERDARDTHECECSQSNDGDQRFKVLSQDPLPFAAGSFDRVVVVALAVGATLSSLDFGIRLTARHSVMKAACTTVAIAKTINIKTTVAAPALGRTHQVAKISNRKSIAATMPKRGSMQPSPDHPQIIRPTREH
jgi:hypothetical protein